MSEEGDGPKKRTASQSAGLTVLNWIGSGLVGALVVGFLPDNFSIPKWFDGLPANEFRRAVLVVVYGASFVILLFTVIRPLIRQDRFIQPLLLTLLWLGGMVLLNNWMDSSYPASFSPSAG